MLNDEFFMDSTHRKANANKYEDVIVKEVKKSFPYIYKENMRDIGHLEDRVLKNVIKSLQ